MTGKPQDYFSGVPPPVFDPRFCINPLHPDGRSSTSWRENDSWTWTRSVSSSPSEDHFRASLEAMVATCLPW